MRYIMSYGAALVLILVIAGWLVSGTLIQGGQGEGQGEQPFIDVIAPDDGPLRDLFATIGLVEEDEGEETEIAAADATETAEPELQDVRAVSYAAEMLAVEVTLRGQTEASATVTVRSETTGTLEELHVAKGDRVEAGDLLCTLDQGTRQAKVKQAEASVAQAEASLEQARADLDTNQQLRDRGLAPENTARQLEVAVTSSVASLEAAEAQLDEARAELDRTTINAAVSGTVQEPVANVGDQISTGGTCATIVRLDPMLFVGNVAEARVGQLDTGMPARIRTVNGDEVEGVVRYIAPTADASTRTFEVEVEFGNEEPGLRSGVTAQAVIDVESIQAHFIPQSNLTLDSDGRLGVRTVTDETVAFQPIEILRDEADGVWVGGLPETVDIITLGQEYVLDGERVRVSYAEEGLPS